MNFYNNLNKMVDYIEENLDKEIDIKKLSQIVGISFTSLQKIFPLISEISLSEYIRKRRLTLAGRDLAQNNLKVMDTAIKYGYTSAIAFSRAFNNFHGIKPRDAKNNKTKLKYYPKLAFKAPLETVELDYEIIELEAMTLYGYGIKTNYYEIKKDAPNLFKKNRENYPELPHPDYGMTVYESRKLKDNYEYYILWTKKYHDFKEIKLEKSRWLKFHISSYKPEEIQAMVKKFYISFLPTCDYSLKNMPELEYYHDGITEFLIPIN